MTDNLKVPPSSNRKANSYAEVPSTFAASIGGYGGDSFAVECTDGKLLYRKHDWHTERREVLSPSPQQWQQFTSMLDQINVWVWKERYEQPILDGTSWSLHVEWGDKSVETSGSNGYPTATGALSKAFDPTPVFRTYLKAVSQLLGGRTFR